MIYIGPGFLAVVVWFGSPLLPSPVGRLSLFLGLPVCRWSSLLMVKGESGVRKIMRWRESLVLCKSFNTLWWLTSKTNKVLVKQILRWIGKLVDLAAKGSVYSTPSLVSVNDTGESLHARWMPMTPTSHYSDICQVNALFATLNCFSGKSKKEKHFFPLA
jgi:hypothetical protein